MGSKNAQKRERQNKKRQLRNKAAKSRVRTEIKKFLLAVKSNNKEEAESQLKLVVKQLDTVSRKGILHKNTAARKKSRLYKKLNALAAE
ncbi:30S ribosomal protein S20 [Spirochaetia bacterium 38H-sp]|uniref:Small ribosomal subunit protein bS20 n=1 Tax=Rarispira pelagica TaxID=3141764 RepID=A0ABU9UE46_9SPIR